VLEFKNVDVSIGKAPILKNISVKFEQEKITSIIGPNGSGKTTLLQTLNGLSTVTAGSIELDDEDFLRLSHKERARKLSFMSQLRDNTPAISVEGLVEHGRFPYMGFSRRQSDEDREAIAYALRYTGLYEQRSYMISELSGGMRQRAYLAMQIAQNSPYMVMDEPMNYLDFPSQREMFNLVKELSEKNKTIIMVQHDLNQALKISDRIVIMKDRAVVSSGTPEECLERGDIQKVFDCEIDKISINGSFQYICV
jgi:iron complex transport system ATP-binding protein